VVWVSIHRWEGARFEPGFLRYYYRFKRGYLVNNIQITFASNS
jgi:hypothetical protein